MDTHLIDELIVSFTDRETAIRQLHDWYLCPDHPELHLTRPFRLRENETTGRTWTMGCGCVFRTLDHLTRVTRSVKDPGDHVQELFVTFETSEADGRQSEHMTQWGRSFLTQYYGMIGAAFASDNSAVHQQTVDDTGGTGRSVPGSSGTANFLATVAAAGNTNFGMVVGTGSGANSGSTVALGTLIAQGTGAGQLNYGAGATTSPSGTAPLSFTITRTFTNNSGAGITINEVGLYNELSYTVNTIGFFASIRDLTGGVTVNNGANTTGTYTLSYTIA